MTRSRNIVLLHLVAITATSLVGCFDAPGRSSGTPHSIGDTFLGFDPFLGTFDQGFNTYDDWNTGIFDYYEYDTTEDFYDKDFYYGDYLYDDFYYEDLYFDDYYYENFYYDDLYFEDDYGDFWYY